MRRLGLCGLGFSALMALNGCGVRVPDPYEQRFACRGHEDCLPDFECRYDTTTSGGIGYCALKSGSGSCSYNPCTYPLICRDRPEGGYYCGECKDTGCGTGEVCVQSSFNGAQSRCVQQCSASGAACSTRDGSGWCVQVPGFPWTPSSVTQPVLACAGCGSQCSDCRRVDPTSSYDGATYCATGTQSGCRYSGCGSGMVCVESRSGDPYCATACSGATCGTGGACVSIYRAFDQAGNSITAAACAYCSGGCGTTACVGPTYSIDYLNDAAPWCSTTGTCDPNLSCKDASACLGGLCADGSSCDATRSCDQGELCHTDYTCKLASCTTDTTCPPNFLCGIADQCGYTPTGEAWFGLGGSESSGIDYGFMVEPTVAVGPNGQPVVAWRDENFDNVFVKAWEASSQIWKFLPGSSTRTGLSATSTWHPPALRIDGSGYPIVAWIDEGKYIYVLRWLGASWQSFMGGGIDSGSGLGLSIGFTNMNVSEVQLALTSSGDPAVAWVQYDDSSPSQPHLYYRYWSGSSWMEVSGSASGWGISGSSPSVSQATLAVSPTSAGHVLVAWTEYDGTKNVVQVRRSVGYGAWSFLGTREMAGFQAQHASVEINGYDEPFIAWEEWTPTSSIINVDRWLGSYWSGTGIITSNAATMPRLTRGGAGDLFLAYENGTGTGADIFAKRWQNGNWSSLHGSDSGNGVSLYSTTGSQRPSVAAGKRLCVTWQEGLSASFSILLRCHP